MSKPRPNLENLGRQIAAADQLRMGLRDNRCEAESELLEQVVYLLRQRVPGNPEWQRNRKGARA